MFFLYPRVKVRMNWRSLTLKSGMLGGTPDTCQALQQPVLEHLSRGYRVQQAYSSVSTTMMTGIQHVPASILLAPSLSSQGTCTTLLLLHGA